MSRQRSNQLSYGPIIYSRFSISPSAALIPVVVGQMLCRTNFCWGLANQAFLLYLHQLIAQCRCLLELEILRMVEHLLFHLR